MTDLIRYRVIERIGAEASEYHWMEVDSGIFTAMPRNYSGEPTLDDAAAYAAKFNRPDREFQFWVEASDD